MEKIILVILIFLSSFNIIKAGFSMTIFGKLKMMQKMSKSKNYFKTSALNQIVLKSMYLILVIVYLILAK